MNTKSTKDNRDERARVLKLKQRFENRITIAKHGKEFLDAGDYGHALSKFMDYLNIMAEIKEVKDIYSLRPAHFDAKKDVTELLMISHIYFEMARLYDAIPKYHENSKRCLEQFVLFTANQPYQVVNSEMVRKFVKKSTFKNPGDFRFAYEQIYVQSKKCYVVTFCYGEEHKITHDCREFKEWLLEYSWGFSLVQFYYRYSSTLIENWGHHPILQASAKFIAKPFLLLFSKTFLRVILKKC